MDVCNDAACNCTGRDAEAGVPLGKEHGIMMETARALLQRGSFGG